MMRTVRGLALIALAVSCSSGKSPTPAPTTAASASTTVTAPAAPTSPPAGSSTTAAATSTTVTGLARCRSSQLSAALTMPNGAAGTAYSHLTFTNKAPAACTMSGYPGLSFVDGSGHQIGAPVPRMSGYGGLVTLAPSGGMAAAVFAYHDAYVGTSPQCMTPVHAAGLRIYPPGETAAVFYAYPTLACSDPAATGVATITAVADPATLPG